MKNHLKRIATPSTWIINRKQNTFVVRPKPGAHSLDSGLPLGVIMRDVLGLAKTMAEVKKTLNNNEVLVDGKRRKDHRLIVGLFDVISIPSLNLNYLITLDTKGRLVTEKVADATTKTCRVVGKSVLPKGKMQINLHDGKNIITDKSVKVGDSIVLSLPTLEIKKVLTLEVGSNVFLISGKHAGSQGKLKELVGKSASYTVDGQDIETSKAYLFVVGDKK